MGRGHGKNDKRCGYCSLKWDCLDDLSCTYCHVFQLYICFFLLILGINWVPTKKMCWIAACHGLTGQLLVVGFLENMIWKRIVSNCVKKFVWRWLVYVGKKWRDVFVLGCIFQRHFRFMVFHDFPACFMKVTWLHCKPLDRRFVLGAVRLLGGYLDDHPTNQSKWKWIMYKQ